MAPEPGLRQAEQVLTRRLEDLLTFAIRSDTGPEKTLNQPVTASC
jgi:hypothetical protein